MARRVRFGGLQATLTRTVRRRVQRSLRSRSSPPRVQWPHTTGGQRAKKMRRLRIKRELVFPPSDSHSITRAAFKQTVIVAVGNRKGRSAQVKLPLGRRWRRRRLGPGADGRDDDGASAARDAACTRPDGKVTHLRGGGMPGEYGTQRLERPGFELPPPRLARKTTAPQVFLRLQRSRRPDVFPLD